MSTVVVGYGSRVDPVFAVVTRDVGGVDVVEVVEVGGVLVERASGAVVDLVSVVVVSGLPALEEVRV